MTDPNRFSDTWLSAAEQADRALVHLAAACRRGTSGSVFNDEGVIVTTARAVAGRDRVELVQGDRTVEAKVVGCDAATDIGVARTDASVGFPPPWSAQGVRLGSSLLSASRPGRATRVRSGLVSQIGGGWLTPRGGRVDRYVETDVTPESGFSGGLAFDADGTALGMNSAGVLRGVPLLIEKPTLDRVVSALLAHGRVPRGYLGVGTHAVRLPEDTVAAVGQKTGLLVSAVQGGSAAAEARVLLGDVLLKLGDVQLLAASALQSALEDASGRVLDLVVLRAAQVLTLTVTPGARP